MTYLDVVNAVLRRLREPAVLSSGESVYSQLIRQFVNEAKDDLEMAYDWNRLRHSIRLTTAQGVRDYAADGTDGRERVLDVINVTDDRYMDFGNWGKQNRGHLIEDYAEAAPRWIDRNGFDADGKTIYSLLPLPDKVYEIVVNAIIPQVEYLDDVLDGERIEVPVSPLILGAYMRATEERGDDGSSPYRHNLEMYTRALHNAVAADEAQHSEENIWEIE